MDVSSHTQKYTPVISNAFQDLSGNTVSAHLDSAVEFVEMWSASQDISSEFITVVTTTRLKNVKREFESEVMTYSMFLKAKMVQRLFDEIDYLFDPEGWEADAVLPSLESWRGALAFLTRAIAKNGKIFARLPRFNISGGQVYITWNKRGERVSLKRIESDYYRLAVTKLLESDLPDTLIRLSSTERILDTIDRSDVSVLGVASE